MVGEETDQERGRELAHAIGPTRPDRAGHRQEVLMDKGLTVAAALEELREGQRGVAGVEQRGGLAKEALNVAQQTPKAGAHEVAPLSKQAAQRRRVVLEVGS